MLLRGAHAETDHEGPCLRALRPRCLRMQRPMPDVSYAPLLRPGSRDTSSPLHPTAMVPLSRSSRGACRDTAQSDRVPTQPPQQSAANFLYASPTIQRVIPFRGAELRQLPCQLTSLPRQVRPRAARPSPRLHCTRHTADLARQRTALSRFCGKSQCRCLSTTPKNGQQLDHRRHGSSLEPAAEARSGCSQDLSCAPRPLLPPRLRHTSAPCMWSAASPSGAPEPLRRQRLGA
mmetsp:Transcript_120965/g.342226  ORF Transcript_120965/g.342226 Transcript_120965/m.342226 type:complete len:233 (-) Transcript_120965:101-799(-)